jgi:PAS domain S-box-containing protein
MSNQLVLQNIIDLLTVRIFWKDLNLKYIGCNKAFAQDAGKNSPEELIGKSDFDMTWKGQAELYQADDKKVIESGIAKINYIEPQTTPTGDTIWLSTNKFPLRDDSQSIIGMVGTYIDITQQKTVEMLLLESESRLKRAQVVSHVGNWEIDLLTKTMFASEEAFGIYGFDRNSDHLPLETVQKVVLSQYRLALDGALKALINDNVAYKQEFQIKRVNDGEVRDIYSIAELVKSSDGTSRKVVGTIQDVTELHKAENELRNKNEELQKLNSIMINRELKMVELKNRIAELEGTT